MGGGRTKKGLRRLPCAAMEPESAKALQLGDPDRDDEGWGPRCPMAQTANGRGPGRPCTTILACFACFPVTLWNVTAGEVFVRAITRLNELRRGRNSPELVNFRGKTVPG